EEAEDALSAAQAAEEAAETARDDFDDLVTAYNSAFSAYIGNPFSSTLQNNLLTAFNNLEEVLNTGFVPSGSSNFLRAASIVPANVVLIQPAIVHKEAELGAELADAQQARFEAEQARNQA